MRYAIRCTPGGLLKDDASGNVIDFATYDRIWRQFFAHHANWRPSSSAMRR
jgi:hypothetical protein